VRTLGNSSAEMVKKELFLRYLWTQLFVVCMATLLEDVKEKSASRQEAKQRTISESIPLFVIVMQEGYLAVFIIGKVPKRIRAPQKAPLTKTTSTKTGYKIRKSQLRMMKTDNLLFQKHIKTCFGVLCKYVE